VVGKSLWLTGREKGVLLGRKSVMGYTYVGNLDYSLKRDTMVVRENGLTGKLWEYILCCWRWLR
jgi:hypothetical protein